MMRNPRRITVTDAMIAEHNLSTAPPPAGSLFWTMWEAASGAAEYALTSHFIQGIQAGTLDPVVYGGFNVSDAYYCFNGAPDYGNAAARATNAALKAFLLKKQQGYESYNATFPKIWRVRDGSSIVPYTVCQQYSQFESDVASQQDPIYALVVMLPCEYLWARIAQAIGPAQPSNLYGPWITGNTGFDGAYAMGNFLATFQENNPDALDPAHATNLYNLATEYEAMNFIQATEIPT
jgi:thiaminase/transcriptional activator TenA